MLEKYYISNKDNTDLNVYRCGFEECSPKHSWGPGVRDHYIVHVIQSGKGVFAVNGKTRVLSQGQGFLICPGQIVYYEADNIDPWTYSWVGFNGLKAESILKKAGLTHQNPVFEYTNGTVLKKQLNDMITAARQENVSELLLTGLLYLFLDSLAQNYHRSKPASGRPSGSYRFVARAIEYIDKNYAGSLTVQSLSKSLKIDRSYLSELFTKYLGIPPRDFIIRYRMDKASELLKNPQLSIGDAARSVGYEDPLQFSKTFRKIKGDSPKNYRKNPGRDN
jgi:AraC-like DNA-binding protein